MKLPFVSRIKYNKEIAIVNEKIDNLIKIVDLLESKLEKNNSIVNLISQNLTEAKDVFNSWKDEQGRILDYEGIMAAQEIVDKLLQRFDFYFINNGEEYSNIPLNLKYTKEHIYRVANEKYENLKKYIDGN